METNGEETSSRKDQNDGGVDFRPSMAVKPIAMMVVLIVVTLSLGLWVGPYFEAMGLQSEFSDYAENPLYAFVFLGFVIVFAVVILALRKLLKRRRLKLKYLFAFAVFFSTLYVLTPLIDMAVNGTPDIWDEIHFDTDQDLRGVLPLDPHDPDMGLVLVGNGSFEIHTREGDYEYERKWSVDGLDTTYDPHFNEGLWIFSGMDPQGPLYWTVDANGELVHEGIPENSDGTMSFLGANLAMVEDQRFVLTFWKNDSGGWSLLEKRAGTDEDLDDVGSMDSCGGPLYPVFGFSEGGTFTYNDTSLMELSLSSSDKGLQIENKTTSPYPDSEWIRISGGSFIYFSKGPYNPSGTSNSTDNVVVTRFQGSGTPGMEPYHTGPVASGYHCSLAMESIGGASSVSRLIAVKNDSVHIISNGKEETYSYSDDPLSVFQDGSDGDIYLVFDGIVIHGEYSDQERMQLWIQISALILSGAIIAVLLVKPKWWFIDISGILMGAGVVALMGVSFPVMFTLLLMVLLAAYDAVAVYKTKHMIALADSVVESKMPILLVFPMKWSYRYEDETDLMDPKRKRESLFMGLGDVIIPGILVVSSAAWLPKPGGNGLLGLSPPMTVSVFTMLGMLLGYGILMRWVIKGKAHAGLPPLNGGAIFGFLLGHLIVYGSLVFW